MEYWSTEFYITEPFRGIFIFVYLIAKNSLEIDHFHTWAANLLFTELLLTVSFAKCFLQLLLLLYELTVIYWVVLNRTRQILKHACWGKPELFFVDTRESRRHDQLAKSLWSYVSTCNYVLKPNSQSTVAMIRSTPVFSLSITLSISKLLHQYMY